MNSFEISIACSTKQASHYGWLASFFRAGDDTLQSLWTGISKFGLKCLYSVTFVDLYGRSADSSGVCDRR